MVFSPVFTCLETFLDFDISFHVFCCEELFFFSPPPCGCFSIGSFPAITLLQIIIQVPDTVSIETPLEVSIIPVAFITTDVC